MARVRGLYLSNTNAAIGIILRGLANSVDREVSLAEDLCCHLTMITSC